MKALKKFKKHGYYFLQAKKLKTHAFFGKLKKAQKHRFNFLQVLKNSKNINFIFASLKKLRKHGFNFFAEERTSKKSTDSLFRIYESPKDTNSIFLQAKNTQTCTNSKC